MQTCVTYVQRFIKDVNLNQWSTSFLLHYHRVFLTWIVIIMCGDEKIRRSFEGYDLQTLI